MSKMLIKEVFFVVSEDDYMNDEQFEFFKELFNDLKQ